jgi:sigma-E factor negative regulatory protein RseA
VERISQLMDGELGAESARGELNRLRQDQALRERWDTFHLIGDTLRGERTVLPGFGDRFAQRLTQEPTVLAPKRRPVKTLATYAMSAAASLAAVAWVGWFALGTAPMVAPVVAPPPPAAVAQQPAAPALVAEPAPAPKVQLASEPYDGTLNEYLMAHTGFSPSTTLQGVASYIRSVAAQPVEHR